ncbi:MAG: class I SAM-dependent methyltransferase [Firmicutes bacterium]|jgi:putative AdoMet-dependent methyltransferase|nr:class I SAM-dependent methyltransferase [Bacillota bacterium]
MDKKQSKAIRYDQMVLNPSDDKLGLFTAYDEILTETRRIIYEKNPKRVMEVGCGTGNLCGPLSEKIDVLGIDNSLEMIMRAKEKYNYMHFKYTDFLNEYESIKEFDLIVSSFFIHCLNGDDRKKALRKMVRMLGENGKIVIVDYMYENHDEMENLHSKFSCQEDLVEFLNKKDFPIVNNLKECFLDEYYIFKARHFVNFTWIIEIEKRK